MNWLSAHRVRVAFVLIVVASSVGLYLIAHSVGSSAGRKAGEVAGREVQLAAYTAQIQIRDGQIAGCIRGNADRRDNTRSWTAAEERAKATARSRTATPEERVTSADAAATYHATIEGLRSRIVSNCFTAYPPIPPPDLSGD